MVVAVGTYNVVGGAVLPAWAYVPGNLAVTGVLVVAALRHGLTRADLALADSRRGLRRGLAAGAVAAAVVGVAVLIPATRAYFADDRFLGTDWALAGYHALIRIPLGTALYEEVVFRGVVLGFLLRRVRAGVAVVASSALFGLWHVLPTLDALETNPLGDHTGTGVTAVMAVAAAVAITFVAGIAFCWLRLTVRSLAAPIAAHAVLNASAYGAGFAVVRWTL